MTAQTSSKQVMTHDPFGTVIPRRSMHTNHGRENGDPHRPGAPGGHAETGSMLTSWRYDRNTRHAGRRRNRPCRLGRKGLAASNAVDDDAGGWLGTNQI